MKTLLDIVNSEAFWFGFTALVAYLANTIVSRKWIASMPEDIPLRRIIRAAHGFLAKIDPIEKPQAPRVGQRYFDTDAKKTFSWGGSEWVEVPSVAGSVVQVGPGLMLLLACSTLLMPLCTGCVGTLDDARGRISPAMGAPRSTALSKRCQSLSDREFYLGFTSTAFGATGLGAVVTSIPVDEPKWETTAVIAGASAAAVSVVTGWGAVKSATTYVEEGCAK